MSAYILIWIISLTAISGVIIRPFRTAEYVWALGGAALLVITRLITPLDAWTGIAKGLDVYLFLAGMMLLSEVAREEKLFDWLAIKATQLSGGSSIKLFTLIYGVGILVTIFLSNDATAVVLTPAVAAATRAARVKNPFPYLLICAFIANAASFVLPISNPANLVIYGSHMPSLLHWLSIYSIPSLVSIIATYLLLRYTQRNNIDQLVAKSPELVRLARGGKIAAFGIGMTAIILLVASAINIPLGLPTLMAGALTAMIVIIREKRDPVSTLRSISWSVLPLVAGLFVIVEALGRTGLIRSISNLLQPHAASDLSRTAWGSGISIAFACNLMNNLPAGLIAGSAVQAAHVPEMVQSAVLIGVDLGPNLSITGSLATILWLVGLRREGQTISAGSFLKTGIIVMIPALLATLGALLL